MHYQKDLCGKLASLEKYGWGTLRAAGRWLKRFISSEELSIRQGRDRYGHDVFFVRDRTTGQYQVFSSEHDLRIWLEQRYYNDARPSDLDGAYQRQRWRR